MPSNPTGGGEVEQTRGTESYPQATRGGEADRPTQLKRYSATTADRMYAKSAALAPINDTAAARNPTTAPQSNRSGGPSPKGGLACASNTTAMIMANERIATPTTKRRDPPVAGLRFRCSRMMAIPATATNTHERPRINRPQKRAPGEKAEMPNAGARASLPPCRFHTHVAVFSSSPYHGSTVLAATPRAPNMQAARATSKTDRRLAEGTTGLSVHGGSSNRSTVRV